MPHAGGPMLNDITCLTKNTIKTLTNLHTLHRYFQALCNGRLHAMDPVPFRGPYRPVTHRIIFKIINPSSFRERRRGQRRNINTLASVGNFSQEARTSRYAAPERKSK
jgi:hypothetical protein